MKSRAGTGKWSLVYHLQAIMHLTHSSSSGPLNYGHKPTCGCINMDPTSHSVYLAAGLDSITGFSEGGCTGVNLGAVSTNPPCVNLDTHFPQGRIASLYWGGTGCSLLGWLGKNAESIVSTGVSMVKDAGEAAAVAKRAEEWVA
jgi:hypothetical protein